MFFSRAPRADGLTAANDSVAAPRGAPGRLASGKLARAPLGQLLYAVGDIHGRADLLEALLNQIRADMAASDLPVTLIFLGDYIDRGRQSREVVDLLLRLRAPGLKARFVKGNHEAALLDFLADPESGRAWMALGGAETLFSYGVSPPDRFAPAEDFERASRYLRQALPAAHLAFYQHLETFIRLGDYLFVHAGLRPGRSLDQQTETDMLEIREPFLRGRGNWPCVVVHGHSPTSEPVQVARRIALDTGAFATGKLSAVRLENEGVRFLST